MNDIDAKLDELDRILNDPDTPMQADRVWSLLAEIKLPDALPAADRSARA